MLIVTSVSRLHTVQADEKYVIARTCKIEKGITHLNVLAPSKRLFDLYREWKQNGEWDIMKFRHCYRPRYIDETLENPLAIKALNYLYVMSKHKDIAIACWCNDYAVCHRSLVVEMLQDKGLEDIKIV